MMEEGREGGRKLKRGKEGEGKYREREERGESGMEKGAVFPMAN